jgi:uncharacterized protein YndB with AHSA1/START domain
MPHDNDDGPPPDEVSRLIAAPADRLYEIITDIAHMGRLSPECTGGQWRGGATKAAVGASFTGRNRRGIVRWSTKNTVVKATPGLEFAFETQPSGTRWTYRLEADGPNTVVTESRTAFKPRPLAARIFSHLFLGGGTGHEDEMRTGMAATLDRLKALAEAE